MKGRQLYLFSLSSLDNLSIKRNFYFVINLAMGLVVVVMVMVIMIMMTTTMTWVMTIFQNLP